MWLGILVLVIVAALTLLAWWIGNPGPHGPRPSGGGTGPVPGRDYGNT